MPTRMLRDCTDSYSVNLLSFQAEVTFYRLIMKADDYGRFYGDPQLVKSYLFPRRNIRVADMTRWLNECEAAGLIAFYNAQTRERYLSIRNFNQRMRTKNSKFPAPPDECISEECTPEENALQDEEEILDSADNTQSRVGNRTGMHPPYDRHMPVICPPEIEVEEELNKKNKNACECEIKELKQLPEELQKAFSQWLEVWSWNHGNGKTMPYFQQQMQLERLIRLPEDIRLEAVRSAIAGGWKNINDIRGGNGRTHGKRADNSPEVFEVEYKTDEELMNGL